MFYCVIALVSLFKFREKRFLRTLFYLCLVQVFCESLRNQNLIWSQFVRVEQLICMVVVEAALIPQGVRAKGERKRFLPALTGVVCAGIFVVVEFAVDGKVLKGTPLPVLYAVMNIGLLILALMEIWLMRCQPKKPGANIGICFKTSQKWLVFLMSQQGDPEGRGIRRFFRRASLGKDVDDGVILCYNASKARRFIHGEAVHLFENVLEPWL